MDPQTLALLAEDERRRYTKEPENLKDVLMQHTVPFVSPMDRLKAAAPVVRAEDQVPIAAQNRVDDSTLLPSPDASPAPIPGTSPRESAGGAPFPAYLTDTTTHRSVSRQEGLDKAIGTRMGQQLAEASAREQEGLVAEAEGRAQRAKKMDDLMVEASIKDKTIAQGSAEKQRAYAKQALTAHKAWKAEEAELDKMEIDPDRRSTMTRVFDAISGMFLGAAGRPEIAINAVNAWIDRDIAVQKDTIRKQAQQVGAARSEYEHFVQRGDDERTASMKTRVFNLGKAKDFFYAQAQTSNDAIERGKLMQAAAKVNKEKADAQLKLYEAMNPRGQVTTQTTTRKKPVMAGAAPGEKAALANLDKPTRRELRKELNKSDKVSALLNRLKKKVQGSKAMPGLGTLVSANAEEVATLTNAVIGLYRREFGDTGPMTEADLKNFQGLVGGKTTRKETMLRRVNELMKGIKRSRQDTIKNFTQPLSELVKEKKTFGRPAN